MSIRLRSAWYALCLAAAGLMMSAPVQAQASGGLRLAFAGGPTLNDLEASETLWIGAAGVEWRPAVRLLVLDASVRYFTYTGGERERYILPEVSVQLERRGGAVRPFVGLGGGFAWILRPSGNGDIGSSHLTLGARVPIGAGIVLRAETRSRSIEPLIDFTLGFSWRLR